MENTNVKISFIVPVYNVEKYLQECVYSIIEQKHYDKYKKNIEIILVDDGSTDNSGKICDCLCDQYTNIKVIHKKNGGLASARNAGLAIAKGDYIGFIDSDDRIDKNCIPQIIQWINNTKVDICFMKTKKFFPNGREEDLGENIERRYVLGKPKNEVVHYLSSRPKYPGSSCFKLYKKSFIDKYKLHFPIDNRQAEDLGFTFDCILNAEEFDVLEIPYYEYRQQRKGSITNTFSEKSFWDLTLFIEESVKKACIKKRPIDECCKYSLSFVAYEFVQLLLMLCKMKGKERTKAKHFLKQYRWVMEYGNTKKIKLIKIILNILGYSLTSKLLNYYVYKIR